MRISDWSSDVCSSDLPAPPPVDELSKLRSLAASHDRRYVGDLDIFARFDVRHAFGHVEVDFQILEILGDRSDVDLEPVILAHRRPSLGSCDRKRVVWGTGV